MGARSKVQALVATGVNAESYREILGLQVNYAEDGAGWLSVFATCIRVADAPTG